MNQWEVSFQSLPVQTYRTQKFQDYPQRFEPDPVCGLEPVRHRTDRERGDSCDDSKAAL